MLSLMCANSSEQSTNSVKIMMTKKTAVLVAKISKRGKRSRSIWTSKKSRMTMMTTSTRISTKMKTMRVTSQRSRWTRKRPLICVR